MSSMIISRSCIRIRDGIQILHDAIQFTGKLFVSRETLNKPGRKEEKREQESHAREKTGLIRIQKS